MLSIELPPSVFLQKLKRNSSCSWKFFLSNSKYFHSQAAKMKSVRGALLDLRTVCAASEENYRAILSHLGSEVEIAARYDFSTKLRLRLLADYSRPMKGS